MPLPQASSPAEFVQALWPHAQSAAQKLGVAPEALLSIAALETGWGQSVISHADGRLSNNLFGIKADKDWDGAQFNVPTVEYKGGVATRQQASFRSYENVARSFEDFVKFVRSSPRYQSALALGADPQAFLDLAPDPSQPGDPVRAADRDMTGPEHRFCTGKLFLVSLSRQPYADNFWFGSFYSWFMRGWQANNSMSRTTDKPSSEDFFLKG